MDQFERNVLRHRIIQRLGAAHESSPSKAVVKERVGAVDTDQVGPNTIFSRVLSVDTSTSSIPINFAVSRRENTEQRKLEAGCQKMWNQAAASDFS